MKSGTRSFKFKSSIGQNLLTGFQKPPKPRLFFTPTRWQKWNCSGWSNGNHIFNGVVVFVIWPCLGSGRSDHCPGEDHFNNQPADVIWSLRRMDLVNHFIPSPFPVLPQHKKVKLLKSYTNQEPNYKSCTMNIFKNKKQLLISSWNYYYLSIFARGLAFCSWTQRGHNQDSVSPATPHL